MTYHINNNGIKCPGCGKQYIPYKKDFPCPFCNMANAEFIDIIPQIVDSMMAHKLEYGIFAPDAWTTQSVSDEIQMTVFMFLDMFEYEKQKSPNVDEDKYLEEVLDEELFKGYREPLARYYKGIIIASYKLYKEETKGVILNKGTTTILDTE